MLPSITAVGFLNSHLQWTGTLSIGSSTAWPRLLHSGSDEALLVAPEKETSISELLPVGMKLAQRSGTRNSSLVETSLLRKSEPTMQTRLVATAVVLAAVLSGCSMLYRVRPGQSKPAMAVVAPEQRAAIWQRAVTILLDEGFIPELLNESVCFISARRRADLVDDALAGSLVLIAISPEGNLRVEVGGSGIFQSERDLLSAVSELQGHLLSLIVRQAVPTPLAAG